MFLAGHPLVVVVVVVVVVVAVVVAVVVVAVVVAVAVVVVFVAVVVVVAVVVGVPGGLVKLLRASRRGMVLASARPTQEGLALDVDHQVGEDSVLLHFDPRGDGCCLVVVSSQSDSDGAGLELRLFVVSVDGLRLYDFPVFLEEARHRRCRHPPRDEVDLDVGVPGSSSDCRCDVVVQLKGAEGGGLHSLFFVVEGDLQVAVAVVLPCTFDPGDVNAPFLKRLDDLDVPDLGPSTADEGDAYCVVEQLLGVLRDWQLDPPRRQGQSKAWAARPCVGYGGSGTGCGGCDPSWVQNWVGSGLCGGCDPWVGSGLCGGCDPWDGSGLYGGCVGSGDGGE